MGRIKYQICHNIINNALNLITILNSNRKYECSNNYFSRTLPACCTYGTLQDASRTNQQNSKKTLFPLFMTIRLKCAAKLVSHSLPTPSQEKFRLQRLLFHLNGCCYSRESAKQMRRSSKWAGWSGEAMKSPYLGIFSRPSGTPWIFFWSLYEI